MKQPSKPSWEEIETAFWQAQQLADAPRAEYLSRLRGRNVGLYREVRQLLQAAAADTQQLGSGAPRLGQGLSGNNDSAAALAPGARFKSWRIASLIGRGGMGEVYRCENLHGDEPAVAAVKFLRLDAVNHLERFEAERHLVARLEHAGIARFLDGGWFQDRP